VPEGQKAIKQIDSFFPPLNQSVNGTSKRKYAAEKTLHDYTERFPKSLHRSRLNAAFLQTEGNPVNAFSRK